MALAAFVCIATFLVWLVLLQTITGRSPSVRRRVGRLANRKEVTRQSASSAKRWRRPEAGTWMSQLQQRLIRADIELPVQQFLLRWVLVVGCLGMFAFLLSQVIGLLIVMVFAYVGTALYLKARQRNRVRRFNDGLFDALTMISNSLRSGMSFVQAMFMICQETKGPIQEEFTRITNEMQVGVGIEQALNSANERIGSDDFDLVVTAISIQRQVGGNLSQVLDQISETIRERVRLKREVKALTAQGKMSAIVFMVLPGGMGAIIYVINPAYMGVMFTSQMGWMLLIGAAIGQALGFVFIRRIVNVEL